jgi:hypothetical protein
MYFPVWSNTIRGERWIQIYDWEGAATMQGERMLVTDLGCVQIQEGCERCARVSLACRGADLRVLGENRGKRKLPGTAVRGEPQWRRRRHR